MEREARLHWRSWRWSADMCVHVFVWISLYGHVENQAKMFTSIYQNSTKNHPKICQKSSQKSTQNRSKIDTKSALEPISFPRPFLVRFRSHFGSNLEPSWGPSWGHVGQEIDFWRFPKACKNDHDFQHPSGPSWDRFWSNLGVQNRTKINPRSVSRAIMKQMQRSSKSSTGAVFLRIGRIEKRSKSNKKSS